MKILVVTSKFPPEYSGSGLRALNTYKRLNKNYKIDYSILTSSLEHSGYSEYFYDDKKIIRVAGLFEVKKYEGFLRKVVVWLNLPFEIYRSKKFIKGKIDSYDILHTFGDSWAVGFFSLYFAYFNKPVVRELCNEIESPYFPLPFKRLFKKIFRRSNMMMIAISPKLESLALENSVKSIWQRPNPVDEKKFNLEVRKKKLSLRSRISPFAESDIVLSYVATFWRNKNQLFLLRLLSKLDKKYKLVLAGPVTHVHRSYFKAVLAEVDNLELSDRVHIVDNFIDNPQDYISLSDVYLFPSRHEGLGTPLLEAQACGVPVVMNEMPGISDKWLNIGKAGYVCRLYEDEWVQGIERALKIKNYELLENAKFISRVAGSKKIDKEYFDRFTKIYLDSLNE